MRIFQELYDTAPEMKLSGLGLEEQYHMLGIASHLSRSKSEVSETIKKRILDLLKVESEEEDHVPSYELYGIKETWFYKDAIYNREDYTTYYRALDQLQYMYGSELKRFVPFTERVRWVEAMTLLKVYMDLNKRDAGSFVKGREKEKDRVSAVKRLMKLGAKVNFTDDGMRISNIEPILRKIGDNIEAMGGVRCIEYILSRIEYDSQFQRFIVPSPGGSMGIKRVKPAVPIGYIVNMAYNKVCFPGRKDVRTCIGETVRLTIDICTALYSAQSYIIWEDVFIEQRKFEKAFEKWISQDSLYNIPQSSPVFVREWMEFLLKTLESRGMSISTPYTLQDYRKVMLYMMSLAETKTFRRLPKSVLLDECGVKPDVASAILNDVVCCVLNPGYTRPLDFMKVTAPYYPAFRLPNGDVMLYPASLGAMGWYEVLMSRLRVYMGDSKRVDREAGKALELFLRKVLKDHGIDSVAGRYRSDGIEGECDAIVQSKKTICLLELKKKNLTRKSREGYVYQMLLDFACAVFNPQVQAFRTEAVLVRDGTINLVDNRKTVVVDYKKRRVLRMSVSLNDFGPIHEQYILDNIIRTFCAFTFSVDRDEIAETEPDDDKVSSVISGYEELAKKQKQLEQYLGILMEKIPNYELGLFFGSSFYSMEQLYYLISESYGVEDFIAKLDDRRMLVIGDGNFWCEEKLRKGNV